MEYHIAPLPFGVEGEELLNIMAKAGWRVVAVVARPNGLGLLAFLERAK